MVTDTIEFPSGSIVVGEVWTTVIGERTLGLAEPALCSVDTDSFGLDEGAGAKFADETKPRPVVRGMHG